eukprot:3184831-Amphidinium_carterae.1
MGNLYEVAAVINIKRQSPPHLKDFWAIIIGETAKELTIPRRHSSSHSHQEQGAVERFHKTLFVQLGLTWWT